MRNPDKTLVGKPEGTRPHGRPRSTWEGDVKMELKIGRDVVNWIHLV
jgi:hypothetical protein